MAIDFIKKGVKMTACQLTLKNVGKVFYKKNFLSTINKTVMGWNNLYELQTTVEA